MGLAVQLEEATRKRPKRSRKASKPPQSRLVLLAAASRANAEVQDPEMLDSMIDDVLVERIRGLLDKIYSKPRKFKTTRTDEIQDDEIINYGSWENPDEIDYSARVEYPAEVINSVSGSLSPKFFSKDLAIELDAEVSPSSAAKKIASDREVLAFAGKQAFELLLKGWDKGYGDPPSDDSKIADQAREFALEDAEDVEMHANPKEIELSHVADLELHVRSVKSKLSFISPWKLKIDTFFTFRAKLDWDRH
jgi:hypothetical protein